VYYTNATNYYTRADSVYLQGSEEPYRYDYLGNLNTGPNLVWISSQSYYSWVSYFLYTDKVRDCPPPYTDYTNPNCFDYSLVGSNPPAIFECFTGLMPYYCPALNQTIEKAFGGYL